MTGSDLRSLRERIVGSVLGPQDAGYDQARRVHNGLVDKRPAVIVRCRKPGDIAEAIRYARAQQLEIAVKGGGHNVSGRATVEGGLLIDLSLMKEISVNAAQRTAQADGGVTWGEFNRETQKYGLATTGGVVSTTGIAGLTLGGGYGYLAGMHGLAVDNLIGANLVMADGSFVAASAQENADLFWAIRGGGGNFGVAASLEYRLHPVGPTVTAGIIAWPVAKAHQVLRFYRDLTASAPDQLTLVAALLYAPGSDVKVAGIIAAHCGSLADGETCVRKIKDFDAPMLDTIGQMPYCDLNGMIDNLYPEGALYYWKSSFLHELSDDAMKTMIDNFQACPSTLNGIILEHWHGAAARVARDTTAFPHRRDGHNHLILSEWKDTAGTTPNVDWTRRSFAAMQPFSGEDRYVNYMDQDDGATDASGPYGANYARLAEIKAKYDPDNVFHLNQNVRPGRPV